MKNTFLRRSLAAVLAALMLSPLMACRDSGTENGSENGSENSSETVETPDYSVDAPILSGLDSFEISYYNGPHGEFQYDDAVIADIAAAGFTSIPIERWATPEDAKKALTVFKKYGLTCSALHDDRVYNMFKYWPADTPQEQVDARVQEIIDDYAEFDNIEGWWIWDEPSTDRFEIMGKIVDAFRRLDPERVTFVNLFPNYASPEQLGAESYEEYVKQFLETVKPHYLCYDNYYFKYTLRDKYFTNAELIRKLGIEAGVDQMAILLLTQHEGYKNLTKAELLYEVNMSLVYGFKQISYFTYWVDQYLLDQDEPWSNGCVAEDGTKYQHYYSITEINKAITPLGNELVSKESVAVFHIPKKDKTVQEGCTEYTSYGALGKVDGQNFVIGFFNDGSFMIVNNYYYGSSKNEMVLLEQTAQLEYFDTASASWKSIDGTDFAAKNENGQHVLSFEKSEGILFRVK